MPDSAGCFIVGTMTTTKNPTMDEATAERLSARFGSVFETFDPRDLFAPDAFFDLNMPVGGSSSLAPTRSQRS